MPLSKRFSRNTFLRSALITAGLLLLVIGVGTIWGGISYERTQREAGQQLSRRLQIAELFLGTVLTHAVDAAHMAAAETRLLDRTDHAQLAAALLSRKQHWHDDIEFDLVDATGALASTDALGAPPRPAGAGRVALRRDAAVLGPPYRRGSRWMLPVYIDAGSARTLVASVALATVIAQWQRLELPPQAVISLIGPDERIWLRAPFDDAVIGRSVPWPELLEHIRTSGEARGLSGTRASAVDGIKRRYAWTGVDAADGLHMIAGLPVEQIAQTWLTAFSLPAAATLILAVAMAVVVPVVLRQAHGAELARQRATERLRISEERWQFALDGSDVGVWDWDAATDTVYFSPRWKAMLGYDGDEIGSGLHEWSSRIHPDDRDAVFADLTPHLRGSTPLYMSEHRMRCKDGSYLWILDRGKVVARGPDNEPLRVVGTHTDISDRKRAEEALLAQAAAERASRAKSEFLSRMSHELRTPLNAVLGFSQLLRHDPVHPLDAAQRQRVEQIEHSGGHLLALINEILDLTRIEADRLPVNLAPVPVPSALTAASALVLSLAAQHGVSLRAPEVAADDLVVSADATRLTQILVNLLTNAIKYNQRGGSVSVQAQRRVTAEDAPHVAIVVTDTGRGMSDAQLAQLFQPFNRLGAETSGVDGTGIGLVLSRRLARLMHGDLQITSEVGRGTQATLLLPAWPQYGDAAGLAAATPASTAAATARATTAPAVRTAGAGATATASSVATPADRTAASSMPSASNIVAGTPAHAADVAAPRRAISPPPAASVASATAAVSAAAASSAPAAAADAARPFHLLYIEEGSHAGQLMRQVLRLRSAVSLTAVDSAQAAIEAAAHRRPDLLLMDVAPPEQDGRDALALLRAQPALQGIEICALVTRAHATAAVPAAAVRGFDLALSQPLDVAAFIALLDRQIARAADRPLAT